MLLGNEQYILANDHDYGPEGNESDENSPQQVKKSVNNLHKVMRDFHQILFHNLLHQNRYYIIEPVTIPTPRTPQVDTIPIQNYALDVVLDEVIKKGLEKLEIDKIPDHGPFSDTHGPNLDTESSKSRSFLQ